MFLLQLLREWPSLLQTTLGKSVISKRRRIWKKKREVPRSTSLSLSLVVLPLLPHYASLDLSWEESYSYSFYKNPRNACIPLLNGRNGSPTRLLTDRQKETCKSKQVLADCQLLLESQLLPERWKSSLSLATVRLYCLTAFCFLTEKAKHTFQSSQAPTRKMGFLRPPTLYQPLFSFPKKKKTLLLPFLLFSLLFQPNS